MESTTSNGVFNENKNKKMTKEPKLKWGDRTAAVVDEVGYTSLKDVIIAEVHRSVADEAGAWRLPEAGAWQLPEDSKYRGPGVRDVSMEKPRAGAYYKYIKIKNIVHEES